MDQLVEGCSKARIEVLAVYFAAPKN